MLRAVYFAALALTVCFPAHADDVYIWGPDQRGLQAGARLLSAVGKLNPGDPVVVEFVLKNTSDKETTVVIQQFDDTYPVLGIDNRIELNILGSSQRRWQHKIAPGEVLKKRQYRVTFSTEGLPPGKYNVTAGSAFWLSNEKGGGTGVPHSRKIPIVIGDPSQTKLTAPKAEDDPKKKIYWGKPAGGLIVGGRFPGGQHVWKNGDFIEAQLFLYNASDEPIEVEYEIPATPTDWNLHLQHESNEYVRLDSTWFSGAVPQIRRTVTIDPAEPMQITGIEGKVKVGGNDAPARMISGPSIQLLAERTEFKHGDSKRLIDGKGNYTFQSAITMHRQDIPDLTMVISAAGIPFEVNPDPK